MFEISKWNVKVLFAKYCQIPKSTPLKKVPQRILMQCFFLFGNSLWSLKNGQTEPCDAHMSLDGFGRAHQPKITRSQEINWVSEHVLRAKKIPFRSTKNESLRWVNPTN
jgi:hypothetical protein